MNAQTQPDVPDGFDYQGDIYRPPMEAQNILIQATVGCSHGKCTFCSGYPEKGFSLKPLETLERDLRFAEHYCSRQDRVFVMDGNALCMPMRTWEWLLSNIRGRLPWVRGSGAFATGMDVAAKSDAELKKLRGLGLDRIHLGIESGRDDVLEQVRKGVDSGKLLRACLRLKEAGMQLYVTVLLGITDRKISLDHARRTGELLSAAGPDEIIVMTLIPRAFTPMRAQIEAGELDVPDRTGVLHELRALLEHTNLDGGTFNHSHSSGYLSFKVRLPEEKESGLSHIDSALLGTARIKTEFERMI